MLRCVVLWLCCATHSLHAEAMKGTDSPGPMYDARSTLNTAGGTRYGPPSPDHGRGGRSPSKARKDEVREGRAASGVVGMPLNPNHMLCGHINESVWRGGICGRSVYPS